MSNNPLNKPIKRFYVFLNGKLFKKIKNANYSLF